MQQGHRQRMPRQGKLFETPSDRPRWTQIPLDVRRTVTEQVARMLRQQGRQQTERAVREVGDE